MRKPYEWQKRVRKVTCKICGKVFVTSSLRAKYCDSPACRQELEKRHRERIYQHRKLMKGIK